MHDSFKTHQKAPVYSHYSGKTPQKQQYNDPIMEINQCYVAYVSVYGAVLLYILARICMIGYHCVTVTQKSLSPLSHF